MAKIGLPKGSGKRLKVREKSMKSQGILDIEWQPCVNFLLKCLNTKKFYSLTFTDSYARIYVLGDSNPHPTI